LGGEDRQTSDGPCRLDVGDSGQVLDEAQPQARRLGRQDLHQGGDAGHGNVIAQDAVDLRPCFVRPCAVTLVLLPETLGRSYTWALLAWRSGGDWRDDLWGDLRDDGRGRRRRIGGLGSARPLSTTHKARVNAAEKTEAAWIL